jgi:hypothetical protein
MDSDQGLVHRGEVTDDGTETVPTGDLAELPRRLDLRADA